MAGVKIRGYKETKRDIEGLKDQLKQIKKAEFRASAMTIVRNIKRAAPVRHGQLKRLVSFKELSEGDFEIVSGAIYSAYMEWGTGRRAFVPSDQRRLAAQYRSRSRRRIEGIRPRPFIFPPFNREVKLLVRRLQKIEKQLKLR